MTTKQRFGFIFLSLLGYSFLAGGVIAYLEHEPIIAIVCAILGLGILISGFFVARTSKDHGFSDSLQEVEASQIDEFVSPTVTLEDEGILHEDTLDDEPTKSMEDLAPLIEKNNPDLIHYAFLDTNQDGDVIRTQLFEIEMLNDNLNALVDAMNTYGLVKQNPIYHYRLESFLKLDLYDLRVDEVLYQAVPYLTLTPQILESLGQTIYLVKAGVNANNLNPIGYLPYNINLDIKKIKAIRALFRGGSYRFLDSQEKDFMTLHDDLKLHILIYF